MTRGSALRQPSASCRFIAFKSITVIKMVQERNKIDGGQPAIIPFHAKGPVRDSTHNNPARSPIAHKKLAWANHLGNTGRVPLSDRIARPTARTSTATIGVVITIVINPRSLKD